MGKNQQHKAMKSGGGGGGGENGGPADDGMTDGTFHSPEWHAARIASLQNVTRLTYEEWKEQKKDEEKKRDAMAGNEEQLTREYREKLDAERAKHLSRGLNHADLRAEVKGKEKGRDKDKKARRDKKERRREKKEKKEKKQRRKEKGRAKDAADDRPAIPAPTDTGEGEAGTGRADGEVGQRADPGRKRHRDRAKDAGGEKRRRRGRGADTDSGTDSDSGESSGSPSGGSDYRLSSFFAAPPP